MSPGNHLVDHITKPELRSDNTLHVVVPISNPVRYQSRYRLARQTITQLAATAHVKLIVVEAAYGDRHHELVELCQQVGAEHIPLRIKTEIWVKENMCNLGIRHAIVRHGAKYLAWVDGDVEFDNKGWALETLHQLQHYPIVQPWQSAINMGPTKSISKSFNSVGEMIRRGVKIDEPIMLTKDGKVLGKNHHHRHGHHHRPPEPYLELTPAQARHYNGDPAIFGHSGYAWACTRTFWEHVGGLIEFAILGSADHHMALGCRGYYSHSVHSAMKGSFMEACHLWQKKAMQLTHGRIGAVHGFIKHYFHGPMERRYYVNRWEILIKHGYDPILHLHKDGQGVIYLAGNPLLEHAIQEYNRNRLEDSIEEY